MTADEITEKRQHPRFLCSDTFSECELLISEQRYCIQSIDFNRYGIGLFSFDRLPIFESCTIEFSYQTNDQDYHIVDLPCILARHNETEVGSQYGIKFQLQHQPNQILDKLKAIENSLNSNTDNGDRYGIFS